MSSYGICHSLEFFQFYFLNCAGLGTSTAKEAKEYFADMERHRILFRYAGPEDDAAITLVIKLIKNFVPNTHPPSCHTFLPSLGFL